MGRTLAMALAVLMTNAMADARDDRLQVALYKPEAPLSGGRVEPRIARVRWSQGDLEVWIEHPAPCGSWIPINPQWRVSGSRVVLNYDWLSLPPNVPAEPERICMKHVRAWVFGVPNAKYEVSIADSVPRFKLLDGSVNRVDRGQ